METSYSNHYSIIQTFKENELQKVFIGRNREDNQVVVINNIYINKDNSIQGLEDRDYKKIFDNIVHFEKNDDKIVIITGVNEGLSLNEYLTDFNPSFIERINLIYKYLNSIKKYDSLPNNAQSILVDESQIIVAEDEFFFGELLIFSENSSDTEDFGAVKNNIISVMRKLTSLPHVNYEELPIYIKVVGFIDDVRKNDEIYTSIEKIFDGFGELDVVDLPAPKKQQNVAYANAADLVEKTADPVNADSINIESINLDPVNEDIFMEADNDNKRLISIGIAVAGIATAILVGLFVFKSMLPSDKNPSNKGDIPNGVIDINANDLIEDDLMGNDGVNNVEIDGNKMIEPNNNIDYISEDIEMDLTNSKYSTYSFMLPGYKGQSHKITINQGAIEANSRFLMWIKSSTDEKVSITIEGYSNGSLSFRQSMVHKPLYAGGWELVQLTLDKGINGPLNIIFNDLSATIWVDKISVDIFK